MFTYSGQPATSVAVVLQRRRKYLFSVYKKENINWWKLINCQLVERSLPMTLADLLILLIFISLLPFIESRTRS